MADAARSPSSEPLVELRRDPLVELRCVVWLRVRRPTDVIAGELRFRRVEVDDDPPFLVDGAVQEVLEQGPVEALLLHETPVAELAL